MSEGEAPRVDPGPIMDLATGYWASKCFLTANGLGVFETRCVYGGGPVLTRAHSHHLTLHEPGQRRR